MELKKDNITKNRYNVLRNGFFSGKILYCYKKNSAEFDHDGYYFFPSDDVESFNFSLGEMKSIVEYMIDLNNGELKFQ